MDDPVQLHRGFPGVGFTHSLLFGVVLRAIIFLMSRNQMWTFSFLLGAWAHVFSDTLDSVGVMLFWPLTDWHMHLDVWEYVGQAGRKEDAIAYYTSLGGRLGPPLGGLAGAPLAHVHRRALPPRDRPPRHASGCWLRTKASDPVMLTLYRASAFFGVASIIGWYVWALLVNDFQAAVDWTPGGPAVGPARRAALILGAGTGGADRGRRAEHRRPQPPSLPRTAPTKVPRRTSKARRTSPGLVTRRSVPQGSRGVAHA